MTSAVEKRRSAPLIAICRDEWTCFYSATRKANGERETIAENWYAGSNR
jgi:hypothetical protein